MDPKHHNFPRPLGAKLPSSSLPPSVNPSTRNLSSVVLPLQSASATELHELKRDYEARGCSLRWTEASKVLPPPVPLPSPPPVAKLVPPPKPAKKNKLGKQNGHAARRAQLSASWVKAPPPARQPKEKKSPKPRGSKVQSVVAGGVKEALAKIQGFDDAQREIARHAIEEKVEPPHDGPSEPLDPEWDDEQNHAAGIGGPDWLQSAMPWTVFRERGPLRRLLSSVVALPAAIAWYPVALIRNIMENWREPVMDLASLVRWVWRRLALRSSTPAPTVLQLAAYRQLVALKGTLTTTCQLSLVAKLEGMMRYLATLPLRCSHSMDVKPHTVCRVEARTNDIRPSDRIATTRLPRCSYLRIARLHDLASGTAHDIFYHEEVSDILLERMTNLDAKDRLALSKSAIALSSPHTVDAATLARATDGSFTHALLRANNSDIEHNVRKKILSEDFALGPRVVPIRHSLCWLGGGIALARFLWTNEQRKIPLYAASALTRAGIVAQSCMSLWVRVLNTFGRPFLTLAIRLLRSLELYIDSVVKLQTLTLQH